MANLFCKFLHFYIYRYKKGHTEMHPFDSCRDVPWRVSTTIHYACFLASISKSSILMAESLMTVPGPKMATAPAS